MTTTTLKCEEALAIICLMQVDENPFLKPKLCLSDAMTGNLPHQSNYQLPVLLGEARVMILRGGHAPLAC